MEECLSETSLPPVRDGYTNNATQPNLEEKGSPSNCYVDKTLIKNYKYAFATFVDRAVATLQRVPIQKSLSPNHDVCRQVFENDDIEDLYDNSKGFMSESSSLSNLQQYPTKTISNAQSPKNSKGVRVPTSLKTKIGSSVAPKNVATKKPITASKKSTTSSDLNRQKSKHSIIPAARCKTTRANQSLYSPHTPSPDAGFTKSLGPNQDKCPTPRAPLTYQSRKAKENFRKNSENSLNNTRRSLVIIPKINNAHFVKKKYLEQKYGLRQCGREAEEEKPFGRSSIRISNYEKPLGLTAPSSPDSSIYSRQQSTNEIKESQCCAEEAYNVLDNFALCDKSDPISKNQNSPKDTKKQSLNPTEHISDTCSAVRSSEKPIKKEENLNVQMDNIFQEQPRQSYSMLKPKVVSKLKNGAFLNPIASSRKSVKKVISVPKLNVRERIAAFEKLQCQNTESPKKQDHVTKECSPRIKDENEDTESEEESQTTDPCLDIEIDNVVSAIEAMEKNIEKTLNDLETDRTENKSLRSKDELDEIKICSRICAKSKSIMKRTLVLKDPEEKSSDLKIPNVASVEKNEMILNLETLQHVAIDVLQNSSKKSAKDTAHRPASPTYIDKRMLGLEGSVSKTEAFRIQDEPLIGTDSNDICYKETIGRFTIFTSTSNHQVCPDSKNLKRDQGKSKTATQLHRDLSTEKLYKALEKQTKAKKFPTCPDHANNSRKKVITKRILPNLQSLLANRCAEMILKNKKIGKALYVNSSNELSPFITESPQFQIHCQNLANNLCKLIQDESLSLKSSEQESKKSKKKYNTLHTPLLPKVLSKDKKNCPKGNAKFQKPLKHDECQISKLKDKPKADLQSSENPNSMQSSFKGKKINKKTQMDISTDPTKNKEISSISSITNRQAQNNYLEPSTSVAKKTKTANCEKAKTDTKSFYLHGSALKLTNIESKQSYHLECPPNSKTSITATPEHYALATHQRNIVAHLEPPPEAPKISCELTIKKFNGSTILSEDFPVKNNPSTSRGSIKPVLLSQNQTMINQRHEVIEKSSSNSIESKIEFHLQNYGSSHSIRTQYNVISKKTPTTTKSTLEKLEEPEEKSPVKNQSKEDVCISDDISSKTSTSTVNEGPDPPMLYGVSSATLVLESNNHQKNFVILQSNDELNFILDEQNNDTDDGSSEETKDTDIDSHASDFTTDSDSNLTFSIKKSLDFIATQSLKSTSCPINKSRLSNVYSQHSLSTEQPCSKFRSTTKSNWHQVNTSNESNIRKDESSDTYVESFSTPQSFNSLDADISDLSLETSADMIINDLSEQRSNLTFDVLMRSEDSLQLDYTLPLISSPTTNSISSFHRVDIDKVATEHKLVADKKTKDTDKCGTKYLECSSKNRDLLHKYRDNSSTSTSYFELEVQDNSSDTSSLIKKLPYQFWKSNKAIGQLEAISPNVTILHPLRFVFSNSDIDTITQNYDSAPSENLDVRKSEEEGPDNYVVPLSSCLPSRSIQARGNEEFRSSSFSNPTRITSYNNLDQEPNQQLQLKPVEASSNFDGSFKESKEKLCWSKERSCSDSSLDSGAFKINVQPSLSDFTVLQTLEIRKCTNDLVLTSLSHKKSAYLKTIQCLTDKICWTYAIHYSLYKDTTLLGKAVQTLLPSLTYRNVFRNLTELKRDASLRQIKMGENMRLSKMKNRLNHTVRKCLVNQINLNRQQRKQIVKFLCEDLAQSLDNSSANTKCLFRLFNQHLMGLYKKISELDVSSINFNQLQTQTLQDYEMWYQNFERLNEKSDQLLNVEQINKFVATYAKKVNYCFKFTENINLLEIYSTDREHPLFTFDPNQYKDIYHYLLSMYIKANILQTFLEFEQIPPNLVARLNQN